MSLTRIISWITPSPPREKPPIHLPDELIEEIINYIPKGKDSQSTLAALCLVSWQWHNLSIARLYEHPYLYGSNFNPFVRTICPSLNAHIRKSFLSGLVKVLDMGGLVHQGSKSTTARLLGRCRGTLKKFVAPQANFGINCLAALSKCVSLESLDLSLLSESMSYHDLATTLKGMKELRSLCFPRSATKNVKPSEPVRVDWPPKLTSLTLSGDMHGLLWNEIRKYDNRLPNVPHTLTSLTLSRCSIGHEVNDVLKAVGGTLKHFRASYVERAHWNYVSIFTLCPHLQTISISHGYTPSFFYSSLAAVDNPVLTKHPLEVLEIRQADAGPNIAIDESRHGYKVLKPSDLHVSLVNGKLPRLRKLRISRQVNFGESVDGGDWTDNYVAIDSYLRRNAETHGCEFGSGDVGIFFFNG